MPKTRKTLIAVCLLVVGIAPIGIHVLSHVMAWVGRTVPPVEFPAWMEAGGVVLALIAANMLEDGVSGSARAIAEAIKGFLPWKSGGAGGGNTGV